MTSRFLGARRVIQIREIQRFIGVICIHPRRSCCLFRGISVLSPKAGLILGATNPDSGSETNLALRESLLQPACRMTSLGIIIVLSTSQQQVLPLSTFSHRDADTESQSAPWTQCRHLSDTVEEQRPSRAPPSAGRWRSDSERGGRTHPSAALLTDPPRPTSGRRSGPPRPILSPQGSAGRRGSGSRLSATPCACPNP